MSTSPTDDRATKSDDDRFHDLSVPIWILVFLGSLYAIYVGRTLLVPIITSLFAYLTLRPIVKRFQRRGISSTVTAAGLLVSIFGVTILIGITIARPTQQWIASAPSSMKILEQRLKPLVDKIAQFDRATEELEDATSEEEEGLTPIPVEVQQPEWSNRWLVVNGTSSFIAFVTLVSVLTFFLLASGGDQLINNILHWAPDFRTRRHIVEIVERVQQGLGVYLAQVTCINIGLGICVTIAMWALGMPSPLLYGVMATMFNFIPFLGALAGAVVIFVTAVINFESMGYAMLVTGTFLTLTSIEGQFITPWILGRSMELNPLIVLLSLTFWGWMWGFLGVLLAVPMLIAGKFILDQRSIEHLRDEARAEEEAKRDKNHLELAQM